MSARDSLGVRRVGEDADRPNPTLQELWNSSITLRIFAASRPSREIAPSQISREGREEAKGREELTMVLDLLGYLRRRQCGKLGSKIACK